MNYYDEMSRTGQSIADFVNQAINSNNYSNLNKNIQIQVIDLNKELEKYSNYRRQQYQQMYGQRPQSAQTGMYQRQINQAKGTPFQRVSPRYSNAIFKMLFGAVGFFVFLPALFGVIGMAALGVGFGTMILSTLMIIAILAGCGALFKNGMSDKALIDAFYKYSRLCGNEDYISIAKLAKVAGVSDEKLVNDIEKMIKRGYLPHAKLDAEKKTIMLSTEVYEEYLKKEESKIASEQAAAAKAQAEADKKAGIDDLNVSEEVKRTLREGQSFIEYIQNANDKIPDEGMSAKLDQMKRVVERIFAQVKKEPSSAGDLNKLMTYYLPTTQKLLDAYIDLDKQQMESKNIEDTKREIESAMDTINDAFTNLFDSLFRDVAWDISSEVSAMKTMMAQDGLTDAAVNDMRKTAAESAGEIAEDLTKADLDETVDMATDEGETDEFAPELKFEDTATDDGTVRQTH